MILVKKNPQLFTGSNINLAKNQNGYRILIDDNSGVGLNFQVQDINGDKKKDIIIGNKKVVFVFEQN